MTTTNDKPAPKRRYPPTLTDREWECVAWMVASVAWIPDAWTAEIGSVAKKMRHFLGDGAVSTNATPTEVIP